MWGQYTDTSRRQQWARRDLEEEVRSFHSTFGFFFAGRGGRVVGTGNVCVFLGTLIRGAGRVVLGVAVGIMFVRFAAFGSVGRFVVCGGLGRFFRVTGGR